MRTKQIVSAFIFLFLLTIIASSITKGSVGAIGNIVIGPINAGRQVLVLIAIDEYAQWPNLNGPVKESELLYNLLNQYYYFSPDFRWRLYNRIATKKSIFDLLKSFQKGKKNQLKCTDSLIIYFSGHGAMDNDIGKGYWIPYDGVSTESKLSKANWIENSELIGLINKIESDHILIISDSCFAGTLVANCKGDDPKADSIKVLTKIFPYTARKIMTAGSKEFVPSQSSFASLLLNELKRNKKNLYVKMESIYFSIEDEIIRKTSKRPLYGNIKDTDYRDDSRFILFTKKGWEILVHPIPAIHLDPKIDVKTKGVASNIVGIELLEKVIELMKVGNYEMAEKELLSAVEKNADMVDAQNALGILYFNKKDFIKAEQKFYQVIKLKEDYFDAYNYLGMIYMEKKEYGLARDYLSKAANSEAYPNADYAYANLAILEMELGNLDSALVYIEKGIEANSQYSYLYNLKGMLYEMKGKYDESIYNYEKSLQELVAGEDDVNILINLGRVHARIGQKINALKYLSDALSKAESHQTKVQITELINKINNQ